MELTTKDNGTILKYSEQNRKQKRQIYTFIKKVYPSATPRDVIGGLHAALLKDNHLVGVVTNLSKVAEYSKNNL